MKLIDPIKNYLAPLWIVETTTAPAAQAVSTALVKEWLRIDTGDTSNDATIAILNGSAISKAQQYANRSFITQTRRASFGLGDTILLPYTPIQSITSVESQAYDGAWSTVLASAYRNMGNGRIEFNEFGNYRVTYISGYGSTDASVPVEVKESLMRYVNEHYEYRSGVIFSADSNTGYSGLSWKAALSPIRIPTV